ncbi:MAG TPA: hypothetical protein VII11_12085 [Bacteroidota bacterium]
MRTVLLCCCLVVTSVAFAQLNTCLNQSPQSAEGKGGFQLSQKQSLVQSAVRAKKLSPYRPALGVSQYMFDGQSRTAPAMGVQYIPTGSSPHKLTFSGGLVWMPKSSPYATNPSFTGFGRNQFNAFANSYSNSLPSLGLGYFGAEYRYYLMQGDFQPYVGGGAHALGWKYGAGWGATVAPSMFAGASLDISTVFSGYAELRQLVGLGTILGNSSFGGSTSVSVGFAFAPNFSSW